MAMKFGDNKDSGKMVPETNNYYSNYNDPVLNEECDLELKVEEEDETNYPECSAIDEQCLLGDLVDCGSEVKLEGGFLEGTDVFVLDEADGKATWKMFKEDVGEGIFQLEDEKSCLQETADTLMPGTLQGTTINSQEHQITPSAEVLYKCDKCVYTAPSKQQLQEHRKIPSFKCDKCDHYVYNRNSLLQHRRRFHTSFLCDRCGEKFNGKKALLRHKRDHSMGLSSCNRCGSVSKSSEISEQQHGPDVHSMGPLQGTTLSEEHQMSSLTEGPYKCDKCIYTASSEEQLHEHRKIRHSFKCDKCDYYTYKRNNLCQHRHRFHTSFKCGMCGETCNGKIALLRHKRDHSVRLSSCDKGGPVSKSSESSKQPHNRDVHSKGELQTGVLDNSQERQITSFSEKLHKCDKCVYTTPSAQQLWLHQQSRHFSLGCFECDSYVASNRVNLRAHRYRVHASLKCDLCGETFKGKNLLISHKRLHFEGLIDSNELLNDQKYSFLLKSSKKREKNHRGVRSVENLRRSICRKELKQFRISKKQIQTNAGSLRACSGSEQGGYSTESSSDFTQFKHRDDLKQPDGDFPKGRCPSESSGNVENGEKCLFTVSLSEYRAVSLETGEKSDLPFSLRT